MKGLGRGKYEVRDKKEGGGGAGGVLEWEDF